MFRDVYIRNQEEILYGEGGGALEWIILRGCGCPFLSVFKASVDGAWAALSSE